MAKELYLYSPIYDFVAEDLISKIEDNMDDDIDLRTMTPGGSVLASYGIYTKIKEHGNVHLKVDGSAMSAGAFLPLYCKSSECLDVSRFVFHRADMYVENEADQEYLDGINKDLKAKMKAKIDPKIFKKITGMSIEDMFNPETRIDITLTGKQAKEIGLIDKVTKLTPAMKSEITAINNKFSVAAESKSPTIKKTSKIKPMAKVKMNVEQFKARYPKTYAKTVADAVKAEKSRVETCLVYLEIDPKGVKAAIEKGEHLTSKQMAEFSLKAQNPEALKKIAGEAPSPVVVVAQTATEKVEETEKQKDISAFTSDVLKALGKKDKTVK